MTSDGWISPAIGCILYSTGSYSVAALEAVSERVPHKHVHMWLLTFLKASLQDDTIVQRPPRLRLL